MKTRQDKTRQDKTKLKLFLPLLFIFSFLFMNSANALTMVSNDSTICCYPGDTNDATCQARPSTGSSNGYFHYTYSRAGVSMMENTELYNCKVLPIIGGSYKQDDVCCVEGLVYYPESCQRPINSLYDMHYYQYTSSYISDTGYKYLYNCTFSSKGMCSLARRYYTDYGCFDCPDGSTTYGYDDGTWYYDDNYHPHNNKFCEFCYDSHYMDSATGICKLCPGGGLSSSQAHYNNSITACYQKKDIMYSDTTGNFKHTSQCNYTP